MKIKRILLILALIFVVVFALTACNPEEDPDNVGTVVSLTRIVLTGITQLEYMIDEPINIENASLILEYDNNTVETLPLTSDMVTNFNTSKEGTYTVNVVYRNRSTSFTITVVNIAPVGLQWIKEPDLAYVEGTPFSLANAQIGVVYENDNVVRLNSINLQVTGYDSSVLGAQTVTIRYMTFSLDIDIEIISKTPTSISIDTLPQRVSYFVGDSFNPDGMRLKVTYNNETFDVIPIEDLEEGSYNFNYNFLTYNLYSLVTVTYASFSDTFYANVRFPQFTRMDIIDMPVTTGILTSDGRTPPQPINNMVQGDLIDFSTGKVEVFLEDGSSQIYLMSDQIIGRQGFVAGQSGQFFIRIYYAGDYNWGIDLTANVYPRAPKEMTLIQSTIDSFMQREFDASGNVISERIFYQGDIIEESWIEYIDYFIEYNNGDISEIFSLDPSQDLHSGNLICSQAGEKTIVFSFGNDTSVTASLTINVQEITPVDLEILELPTNRFLLVNNDYDDVAGGIFRVTYNNNRRETINFNDLTKPIYFDVDNETLGVQTVTLNYLGLTATYTIEVKDRIVTNIIIDSDVFKINYMQNSALDLSGITLYVDYSDETSETINANYNMLYNNLNLYYNGTDYIVRVPGDNQTITLRFGGKTTSYRINVTPLLVDRLELVKAPKTVYILGSDTELDLQGIAVRLYYNYTMPDGSELTDNASFEEIMSSSYWSIGQVNLSTLGQKTVTLYYTTTTQTSLSFIINVINKEVVSIELDAPIMDVPLAMDLNIEDINLIVYYNDDSTDVIPLLRSYTNYDPLDVTPGERLITISYGGVTTSQSITLTDKRLVSVSIFNLPRTNFVVGEAINLSAGNIQRLFDDGSTDLISMSDTAIKVSGYNINITVPEDPALVNDYIVQEVTITYLKYSLSFEVKTYSKLNPKLNYARITTFYGSSAPPIVTLQQEFPEFVLPSFTYDYKVNGVWQSEYPVQVGTYEIRVTVEENMYYKGGVFIERSSTIAPKTIDVTPDVLSKLAGTQDPVFTYTVEAGGLINGDELTGSLTRVQGENAGEYLILIGTLGNPNYIINLIGVNFTITLP